MIDKALIIIIVFYAAGLSMLGVEITLGQVYHVEMVSPVSGEPINSAIAGYMQQQEFNERTQNIVSANFTTNSTFYDRVETFTTGAAFVAWELVGLMTGTYIFYILLLFGVPDWFVTGLITLYILLLARAIIGYVRGI
jgi:hypothetical protein